MCWDCKAAPVEAYRARVLALLEIIVTGSSC